jgi:hypothetical protein
MPKQRSNGELVQGTLDMLILRMLSRGPMHGYAIAVAIEHRSDDVLRVEEGSCVDTRAARITIGKHIQGWRSRVGYWLDLGNSADSGQFVLGQPLNGRNRRSMDRLRTAPEVFPELSDESLDATST